MQIYQTDSEKLEVLLEICLRQITQKIIFFLFILFLESEMQNAGLCCESSSARNIFDLPSRA